MDKAIIGKGYEPGDGSMDGAQLVNGQWWHPKYGCDSLQFVVNSAWPQAMACAEWPSDDELARAYAAGLEGGATQPKPEGMSSREWVHMEGLRSVLGRLGNIKGT
jgi:hypothetical protein